MVIIGFLAFDLSTIIAVLESVRVCETYTIYEGNHKKGKAIPDKPIDKGVEIDTSCCFK